MSAGVRSLRVLGPGEYSGADGSARSDVAVGDLVRGGEFFCRRKGSRHLSADHQPKGGGAGASSQDLALGPFRAPADSHWGRTAVRGGVSRNPLSGLGGGVTRQRRIQHAAGRVDRHGTGCIRTIASRARRKSVPGRLPRNNDSYESHRPGDKSRGRQGRCRRENWGTSEYAASGNPSGFHTKGGLRQSEVPGEVWNSSDTGGPGATSVCDFFHDTLWDFVALLLRRSAEEGHQPNMPPAHQLR